jgi:hypothetical protein
VRKTRSDPTSRPARLRAVLGTKKGRVLRIALVSSVGMLLLALVVRQARAAVDRMPGCRLEASRPVFLDLPRWVDEDMKKALEAPGLLGRLRVDGGHVPPLRLYDPGVERAIAHALTRHPMIQSVAEVEVRYPAEIRVRASVRAPAALFRTRVSSPGGEPALADVPVAPDGVVLPFPPYARFLSERRPVVVLGVRARYPGLARRWDDSDEQVREAIESARVANRLNQELLLPHYVRIDAVDVSAFPAPPRRRKQGEIVFLLSDGRRVQWGRTERDLGSVTREDGYEVKRDRLLDLLEEPRSSGRRELDVRVGALAFE